MLPVAVSNMLPPPRQQALARFSALALAASLPVLYVSLLRPPPAALAGDTAFWFLMSNCVVGALFFGSPNKQASADGPDDVGLSFLSGGGGGQPAAVLAFEEASTMATTSIVDDDGALPFSVHASVLREQGGEEHEVAKTIGQQASTDKNNDVTLLLKGQGGNEQGTTHPDEAIAGAAAADDPALPGPEPEPEPGLVEEEELPEAWAIAQHSRTPDLLLQHGNKRSGEGKKLRRSATEGSDRPAAEEGSDYWELTDEELNRRVEEFIARFRREMIAQEAGVAV